MQKAKIKERAIWADMLRNPQDHTEAFKYVFASVVCLGFIVIIRILV